jgi:hypothetical protein
MRSFNKNIKNIQLLPKVLQPNPDNKIIWNIFKLKNPNVNLYWGVIMPSFRLIRRLNFKIN